MWPNTHPASGSVTTHTSSLKPSQGLSGGLSPCLSCPQLFHEAAYQADDRQDLLSAISEFLDGSIVIPPSEVEGRDLLRSVAAFQRELLRKRREREQTKVEMTTQGSYVAPGKGQTLWGSYPPRLRSPPTAPKVVSPACPDSLTPGCQPPAPDGKD